MRNILLVIPVLLTLFVFGCDTTQIAQRIDDFKARTNLGDGEIAAGLKEALVSGISKGADQASKRDGYFRNALIKLDLPPEIKKIEGLLNRVGLEDVIDQFVENLNRGAEKAATEAKPIFLSAIKSMTLTDAKSILYGKNDEATQFLKRTTFPQLVEKFNPIIQRALKDVNATKYYSTIINSYNKIPGLPAVNSDLDGYATEKAIDGLFKLIANEEANIRENPFARTSELLKKVFARVGN